MPVSARTRRLLSWLPAALLVLVIGGVVFASFAIQESWWTEENPAASTDQKASDGSTMLTDAGFDYANVEGVARIRIGEGGLTASDLGLPDDGEKSAEFRRPLRVVIAGGEDVYVVDDIAALTAVSADGQLESVTLIPDGASLWTSAVAQMRSHAASFGWDAAELEGLDDQLAEFNRTGEGDTFTVVVGPSDGGAQVTGTLTYYRSGATTMDLTFEPAE